MMRPSTWYEYYYELLMTDGRKERIGRNICYGAREMQRRLSQVDVDISTNMIYAAKKERAYAIDKLPWLLEEHESDDIAERLIVFYRSK